MTYAAYTKVTVENSRAEIERLLAKYGAQRFCYFSETGRAIILFEAHDRRIRFDLPVPEGTTDKDKRIRRERWRALILCIKAKLESVESKIESFEEAFLAHVVLPDGITVGQYARPAIDQAYKTNTMVPLLPAPQKDTKR